MAKQKDIELFLNRLEAIDRRYGIVLDADFKGKSIALEYYLDKKSKPFDIIHDDSMSERKARSVINQVRRLCVGTLADRRAKVTQATLRSDRTAYHRAIRKHYKGKHLSMYCRDKYQKANNSHIAIRLLDITEKEKQDYIESEKARLLILTTGIGAQREKEGRTYFVINNPDSIVKTGLALINSKRSGREKFVNMVLGLMCLTGRRATEVLLMTVGIATLTPIKKETNRMVFHGQLKNEQSSKPSDDYEIYTLAHSAVIVRKIKELQEMVKAGLCLPILNKLDFSEYDTDESTKLSINISLNRAWGRRKEGKEKGNVLGLAARDAGFGNRLSIAEGGDIADAVPTNPDDFQPKQLRSMYVVLSYKYFIYDKKETKGSQIFENFGFPLLGHSSKGDAVSLYANYRIKGYPFGA
ncbi:MAG: protelomerase family protein [Candidatus Parabeggiatoa sp.]|nr:protelomerase family protein [Candidatus Parabeggiatoa sp.]